MIFKWFEKDFTKAAGSVLSHIARYVSDPDVIQDLMQSDYRIEYLDYDWSLNGTPPKEMSDAGWGPDEREPIARLMTFLEHGERMAHECAKAQASLSDDSWTRRFLLSQAKQEAMHARVFQGAIAWLAPQHLRDTPFLPALEDYRRILDDALARRDLTETFLPEQVVLEGLGQAVLTRIEQGLVKRAAPFGRLRRILLHQEEAHHGFGRRRIEQAIERGETDVPDLRQRVQRYLALTDAIVFTRYDLFESIDEDATVWAQDVRTFLPDWCSA